VPAQQLRQVRVRRAQLDQQPEELRQRRAEAAVLEGDADRSEAGLAQPAHLVKRQRALRLALQRALADLGEDGPEPLRKCAVAAVGCRAGAHDCASRGSAVSSRWV
jgi:hypothetical protein